jgi:hypothetical protein
MPKVGEQADIFRALGRFLDDQGAQGIEIRALEVVIQVSWSKDAPGSEHIAVQEHDLESLREQARTMRQSDSTDGGAGGSTGSLAEVMRTLGQELDEAGLEANGIVQEPDGFRVSGVAGGRYASDFYPTSELLERSAERRELRGSGPATVAAIDPFPSVNVGLAVVTHDQHRIGKVAELRGRFFRVEAGMLQRDFWLPAECVAAVEPDQRVLLSPNRTQLESHKSRIAPTYV